MSTTVNLGWLKDKNGDKFAPKTYTSQVYEYDNTPLDEKLQKIDKELESIENIVKSPSKVEIGQQLIVKEVDENGNPVDWEYVDRPCYNLGYVEDVLLDSDVEFNKDAAQSMSGYSKYIDNIILEEGFVYSVIYQDIVYDNLIYSDSRIGESKESVSNNWIYNRYEKYPFYIYGSSSGITISLCRGSYPSPDYDKKTLYLKITKIQENIKQLDEEFIPNSIPRVSVAEIGQILSVKAVDENGKPIEWEAVDAPTGGNVDLSEYVKNTDYATASKAGVVTVKDSIYGLKMDNGKELRLTFATTKDIDEKSGFRPIKSSELDYAVKAGMTTNTLEWTDEEKQAARELIGAGTSSGEIDGWNTPYIDEEGYVVYDDSDSVKGLVEITGGNPTKEGTVLMVNPNAEEVNIYTAEEIDELTKNFSEYPKKVFEYEWKDNYDKINVTAIDFETCILTVDSMPTQITDDVTTTVRVFITTLIDGVGKKFLYGNIPQEFYNYEYLYGVKIGENQLQLYTQNSTVVSTLTDSGNIDLTRLQIYVEKSRNKSISSARIDSIEQSHRYKVIYNIPKGAHQVAGISIYKSVLNGTTSYGDGYSEGYISHVADSFDGSTFYVFALNTYETISMRGVRYSLTQTLYTKFPRVFTVDVYPINDEASKADVTVGYFYPGDKTPTSTSKIIYHDLKSAVYLQNPFVSIGCTSGNGNFILDGTRFEVWDYGEVF